MTYVRLNAYHIMWVMVFFDLPVITKKQKKDASKFRQNLKKEGFNMMQYSVYTRCCGSSESAAVFEKKVERLLTGEGEVSVLKVTDKQFSIMKNYRGKNKVKNRKGEYSQIEMF